MNDEKWGTREGHEISNKDEESTKNAEQNENINMKNRLRYKTILLFVCDTKGC